MKKKILVAYDGLKYSASLTSFAIDLARESQSLLIGAFLNDLRYLDNIFAYGYSAYATGVYNAAKIEGEDEKEISNHIKLFEGACKKAGVSYKVHLDKGVPLQALLLESEFADLILIDVETNFFSFNSKAPSAFLRDLLVESRCPILIVPQYTEKIIHILFSYDGSDSSVYAMKMFSYLFPEWKESDTTIVSVNKNSSKELPNNRDIKDWVHEHFGKANYEVLNGDAGDSLIKFLKENKKQSLVVMGAYGRSAWSRMLHASISNKVMNEVKMPLFITHQ